MTATRSREGIWWLRHRDSCHLTCDGCGTQESLYKISINWELGVFINLTDGRKSLKWFLCTEPDCTSVMCKNCEASDSLYSRSAICMECAKQLELKNPKVFSKLTLQLRAFDAIYDLPTEDLHKAFTFIPDIMDAYLGEQEDAAAKEMTFFSDTDGILQKNKST